METTDSHFNRLIQIVRILRAEDGCPWDRRQTSRSLIKYLQEECHEIINAINNEDPGNLCEELGDFLYLIVMLTEINSEFDKFSAENVLVGISEKLIRRHPHVFAEKRYLDEETLRKQWQEIKRSEKTNRKID